MQINWRPYQRACFDAIKLAASKGINRQLVVMATGTGKRLIAVGLSQDYERTLFLCHREELIEQAYEDFNRLYPLQVGIIKGDRFEADKKIVIGSAQTMWRRLDRMKETDFDCVMADEVHHYLAPTYIKPLDFFKCKQMYGFTATPTRLDGLDFSNIVDEIVYEYPIDVGIKEGWLAPLEAYQIATDVDISQVKKVGGDFNQKELTVKVDIPERNKLIVEKYVQYGQDRQAVVFCASIEHSEHVKEAFIQHGYAAEAIHSNLESEDRRMLNRAFKNRNLVILTNVNVLTEGWDYADVGLVMMARPTQSLALYMQMIGRGTRLKTKDYIQQFNRRDCTILDFVDNTGNHKLVNTWTIEREKPPQERMLYSEKQRDYFAERKAAREAKIKNLYKTTKKLDLFDLPSKKKVHEKGRMLEAATDKQLKWLRDLGVWQEGVEYTKAQASRFITNADAEDWMIRKLAEWGYDVMNGATVGQFYEVQAAKNAEKARNENGSNYTVYHPINSI